MTLLRYGFQHLDPHRVHAATAEHNAAAQRVLENCSFVQEGRDREAIYCAGRGGDYLRFGLPRAAAKRV